MPKNDKSKKGRCHFSLLGKNQPEIEIPDAPPPPKKMKKRPRVAIVLGGGGARGFAHIGILKVLQENNIPIDLVVGTSVGSIMGALFCDDIKSHQMEQEIKNIKHHDILDLALLKIRNGLFTGKAIQNYLHRVLKTQNFEDLKTKLVVTTVNIETGELFPIETGPIAPAVNASCALPPFFHSVRLYGMELVDGGVTDPVPVELARSYNPQLVISVSVCPDKIPGGKATNLFSRFMRSYNVTMNRLAKIHAEQADIVMKPEVEDVSLFDFSSKYKLYQAGIKCAEVKLPEIMEAINRIGIEV